jgi:hypothetical protein
MLDETFVRDYLRLRREHNDPARIAHAVVKESRKVREWESEHVGDPEWDYWEGAHVLPVDLGDGLDYRVTMEVDHDSGRPEDNGDCYDAEDIKAWEDDRWHYYVVTVKCSDPRSGAEASEALGGIDAGDYYWSQTLLDTDRQVWAAVLDYDVLGNARGELLDSLHSSALAESAARDVARGLPWTA